MNNHINKKSKIRVSSKSIRNQLKKHKKKFRGIFIIIIISLFVSLFYTPFSVGEESILASSYIKENISSGYILYNGKIINESGAVVHEWEVSKLGVILPNGDYVAKKSENSAWGKYSWNGTTIWESNDGPHHMISLTSDNTILTIMKEYHNYEGENVGFDIGIEYDTDFNVIARWSTWDNLEEIQSYHEGLDSLIEPHMDNKKYDYYHMNAIKKLAQNKNSEYEIVKNNKTVKPFQEGNWIISFRQGSILLILDKDTKEIVWSLVGDSIEGSIDGQHDPTMLESGNILIFDNGRYRNWSRIIELNPITMEIEWEYSNEDLFMRARGSVESLPNGNKLILEGRNGLIYEVNQDKEIVWEYMNIANKDELQMMYYVKKYSKEFIQQFL